VLTPLAIVLGLLGGAWGLIADRIAARWPAHDDGSIRPTDSLAGSMLLALHLEQRRAMLSAFLDALKIPHADGLIDENHEMKPPSTSTLEKAAKSLSERFPANEVELYLATLYVLDRVTWAGLATILK